MSEESRCPGKLNRKVVHRIKMVCFAYRKRVVLTDGGRLWQPQLLYSIPA